MPDALYLLGSACGNCKATAVDGAESMLAPSRVTRSWDAVVTSSRAHTAATHSSRSTQPQKARQAVKAAAIQVSTVEY